MAATAEPKRIISAAIAARRLGISRPTIAKHIRRELIVPDFRADVGDFFDPDRLPALRQTLAENRQRNWRHVAA